MEPIRVYDSSSSTGAYLSGITHASPGLLGRYRREGNAAWTAISIVSATAGAFTSGGWAVPTSGPTSYEVHIPNAALAAGADWVEIEYYGVANMLPVQLFFELDAVDYQNPVWPVDVQRWLDKPVTADGSDIPIVVLGDATLTAAKFAANAITPTAIQNGAFTAAKFAAGAFDAVWTVLTSGLTLAGSIGKLLVDNINATISSRPTLAQIEASTVLAKEATVSGGFTNTNNLITALNNLSAKMNIFGAPLLEVPDSGSTVYAFTVIVRDDEDLLVNLSGTPTITAANSAAVDRSANLSAVSNPSTGRYTFTYTVADSHPKESLRITVSGNVSGSARYIEWIGAVVDYDTITTLQDVQTKVTNIQTRIPAALISGRMSSDVGAWAGQAVTVDTSNLPVTSVRNYFDTDLTTWLPISGRFATIITNVGNVPTAVLDTVVDNGLTVRQCIRIANSVLHGAATGLNTTPVFKSLDGTKDRVVGTVASGNRTITSRDGT